MNPFSKIEYSTNYEKFKFYKCNRKISQEFVETLIKDQNFSKKYIYSPIIVSEDFHIVDGQHRYTACRSLELPIVHIIDPHATEEDIRIRNMLQNNWEGKNFLDYYSYTNEDYKLIRELRDCHTCSLTILFAAIKKMCGFRNLEFHKIFKEGKLKLEKNKEKFKEFINSYLPAIKNARTIKGNKLTRPYFTGSVVIGFCHHYLTNRRTFNNALNKMSTSSFTFPFCASYEDARQAVGKLSRHAEKVERVNKSLV